MSMLEDVADRLAQKVLVIVEETGDDDIINDVMKVIGASSTTLEEAYLTAVRVRRAEKRALDMIANHVADLTAKHAPPGDG